VSILADKENLASAKLQRGGRLSCTYAVESI